MVKENSWHSQHSQLAKAEWKNHCWMFSLCHSEECFWLLYKPSLSAEKQTACFICLLRCPKTQHYVKLNWKRAGRLQYTKPLTMFFSEIGRSRLVLISLNNFLKLLLLDPLLLQWEGGLFFFSFFLLFSSRTSHILSSSPDPPPLDIHNAHSLISLTPFLNCYLLWEPFPDPPTWTIAGSQQIFNDWTHVINQ